jgi:transcriptional regulator with XRE-family HTH domain
MEMQNINRRVGRRIRLLRELRGLSQEELAFCSGLHRAHMGQIERGEYNVTVLTLQKVGLALRTTVSALLKGIG